MKPAYVRSMQVFTILAVLALPFTLLAWQQKQKPSFPQQEEKTDTIPKKKESVDKKIVDLDDVIDEADEADMDKELLKLKIDLADIAPKLEKQLAEAKIDLRLALKEIDAEKINAEIEASLKDIDLADIKAEVSASIDKIEWEKINKEIEKVNEIDLKELKEEMEKVKPELKKAKLEAEKASKELQAYKAFTEGLEKDGLINKNEDYTIKHSNGELIINGSVQPASVYNKYRSFLEKHKTLFINKTADKVNMNDDKEKD